MNTTALVWFRLDLRLADNPALQAAMERGGPIVPVFVWAPEEEAPWEPGEASRWWWHRSLNSLDASLRQLGSRLILRRGPTVEALLALVKETRADAVFWNRRCEPTVIARDTKALSALRSAGLETGSFNAALLHEPWAIQNKSGKPFQVFTPFWKHCLGKADPPAPLPVPRRVNPPDTWPRSLRLDALELEPRVPWAEGLNVAWQPGEAGAHSRLRQFLDAAVRRYGDHRNRPDLSGTSRLSPHLHFGGIEPETGLARRGRRSAGFRPGPDSAG